MRRLICKICFSVIEQLGAKHLVMQFLNHEDPNVRYEALIAVQKLMVHNWYVTLDLLSRCSEMLVKT